MEKIYLVLAIFYALTSIVLALRLILRRREMSRFAHELEKQKDLNYAQPVKVNCFSKDITNVATVLNELSDIRRSEHIEYERAKQELANVISGISHDFRTPLTASLGYLQMIEKSGELSAVNSEFLAVAIRKNIYLKDLSDDFFEISRLESVECKLQYENVNISNIFSDILLEQSEWTEKRGVSVTVQIQDGIAMHTDRHLIERILVNIFSNAKKYTESRLYAGLSCTNGKTSLILANDIADISAVDTDRVFEPYYRTGSRTESGSGLGLYVVKLLADRLSLDVSAEITEDNLFEIHLTNVTAYHSD